MKKNIGKLTTKTSEKYQTINKTHETITKKTNKQNETKYRTINKKKHEK